MERAINILREHFDTGAVHIVADGSGAELTNVYTLIIYGRSSGFYTLPERAELFSEAPGFRCAHYRASISACDELLAAVDAGALAVSGESIHYNVVPPIIGFYPQHIRDEDKSAKLNSRDVLNTSVFSRERLSPTKSLRGVELSSRTLPEFARDLQFLNSLRWNGLQLFERPEKIGDCDEWWPTLISAETHEKRVYVVDQLNLSNRYELSLHIQLYNEGMLVDDYVVRGRGPHKLHDGIEAVGVDLFLDGVLMDRWQCNLTSGIGFVLGVSTGERLALTTRPQRAGLTLPIAPRNPQRISVGNTNNRNTALRSLGRRWRAQNNTFKRQRVERVYDPREPGVMQRAFVDLQGLTGGAAVSKIVVVDRYSLNAEALEAVVAVAAAHPANVVVDILTKFDEKEKPKRARSSQDRVRRFSKIARAVAKKMSLRIRLHRVDGVDLHDRFLILDDRVWHVGPSFNAIGETISAIVEMTDIKAIGQLLDILDPFVSSPPVFDSADA